MIPEVLFNHCLSLFKPYKTYLESIHLRVLNEIKWYSFHPEKVDTKSILQASLTSVLRQLKTISI